MQEVYLNSVLNIDATHANRPSQRCFAQRSPSASSYWMVSVDWPAGTVSDASRSVIRTIQSNFKHRKSLTEEAIFKCAWTIQERLLAPRMLHFGRHQLIWKCFTAKYLDEWTSVYMSDRTLRGFVVPGALRLQHRFESPRSWLKKVLSGLWNKVFSDYTIANFTPQASRYPKRCGACSEHGQLPVSLRFRDRRSAKSSVLDSAAFP